MMEQQMAHETIAKALDLGGVQAINLAEWKHHLADRWDSLSEVCPAALRAMCSQLLGPPLAWLPRDICVSGGSAQPVDAAGQPRTMLS